MKYTKREDAERDARALRKAGNKLARAVRTRYWSMAHGGVIPCWTIIVR